jgi:hypothetical protein
MILRFRSLTFLWCVVLAAQVLPAQEMIQWKNPSFEELEHRPGSNFMVGTYGDGMIASVDWKHVSVFGETPPDVQPGQFGVRLAAKQGNTYLGMVTRDNNTQEGVYQYLGAPLLKDSTYVFTVWLARSDELYSISRVTGKAAYYNAPTVLQVWGINPDEGRTELLAESFPVTQTNWKQHALVMRPNRTWSGLKLTAFYAPGYDLGNGALLVDDLSPILRYAPQSTLDSKIFQEFQEKIDIQMVVSDSMLRVRARTSTGSTPDLIRLQNPSFDAEKFVRRNRLPLPGWRYFGSCAACNPKVEPHQNSKVKPRHGISYVALLSYKDSSCEAVAQTLSYGLERDSVYKFSLWLAHPLHTYKIFTPTNYNSYNKEKYGRALAFQVWGVNLNNGTTEILAETPLIDHKFWYKYDFLLTPRSDHYDTILLKAAFPHKKPSPYNGCVLVDHCSDIIRIPQD